MSIKTSLSSIPISVTDLGTRNGHELDFKEAKLYQRLCAGIRKLA
ncbi:MAG: hypothetical protein RML92_09340 [Bacteroidia bacterium]|nr:hypothetical protein [Bacteroidia bacterium]